MGVERALADLLRGLTEAPVPDVRVSGVGLDSRRLRQGDLFLACTGGRVAGVDFIDEALRRGARAVAVDEGDYSRVGGGDGRIVPVPDLPGRVGLIAARFFDFPSRSVRVVGVTGTNGKTTVTWLLAQSLRASRGQCGLVGTLGHGLFPDLEPDAHTTPDVIALNRLLDSLRGRGVGHAVMEVSSHALDQRRVDGIEFDVAVFTNLGHDHMDYHADIDRYARAKRRLFEKPAPRAAVFNVDDEWGRRWFDGWEGEGERWGYCLASGPDSELAPAVSESGGIVCGTARAGEGNATRMDVRYPAGGEEIRFETPLIGRAAASNLMAALAALLALGTSLPEAAKTLSTCAPPPGRMECFTGPGKPLVVVDYAHNPPALERALADLRQWRAGRLWCVFGCGGDRDRSKRPLMAAAAARGADEIVLTSDNPRGERPESIMEDARRGFPDGLRYHMDADRERAIAYAVTRAKEGDTVLLAGKGHETWQELADGRRFFSDREQARRWLS